MARIVAQRLNDLFASIRCEPLQEQMHANAFLKRFNPHLLVDYAFEIGKGQMVTDVLAAVLASDAIYNMKFGAPAALIQIEPECEPEQTPPAHETEQTRDHMSEPEQFIAEIAYEYMIDPDSETAVDEEYLKNVLTADFASGAVSEPEQKKSEPVWHVVKAQTPKAQAKPDAPKPETPKAKKPETKQTIRVVKYLRSEIKKANTGLNYDDPRVKCSLSVGHFIFGSNWIIDDEDDLYAQFECKTQIYKGRSVKIPEPVDDENRVGWRYINHQRNYHTYEINVNGRLVLVLDEDVGKWRFYFTGVDEKEREITDAYEMMRILCPRGARRLLSNENVTRDLKRIKFDEGI